MNFDFNQIRSVTRGEVNGSVRFLVTAFSAAAVWIAVSWLSGMAGSTSSTLSLQQTRYRTLTQLAAEYKALASDFSVSSAGDADVIFSEVSTMIELGSRVNRIVPASNGKSSSVEVNRLYAEELTDMIRALAAMGVRIVSAEIRALPAGEERLFTVTATLEVNG